MRLGPPQWNPGCPLPVQTQAPQKPLHGEGPTCKCPAFRSASAPHPQSTASNAAWACRPIRSAGQRWGFVLWARQQSPDEVSHPQSLVPQSERAAGPMVGAAHGPSHADGCRMRLRSAAACLGGPCSLSRGPATEALTSAGRACGRCGPARTRTSARPGHRPAARYLARVHPAYQCSAVIPTDFENSVAGPGTAQIKA